MYTRSLGNTVCTIASNGARVCTDTPIPTPAPPASPLPQPISTRYRKRYVWPTAKQRYLPPGMPPGVVLWWGGPAGLPPWEPGPGGSGISPWKPAPGPSGIPTPSPIASGDYTFAGFGPAYPGASTLPGRTARGSRRKYLTPGGGPVTPPNANGNYLGWNGSPVSGVIPITARGGWTGRKVSATARRRYLPPGMQGYVAAPQWKQYVDGDPLPLPPQAELDAAAAGTLGKYVNAPEWRRWPNGDPIDTNAGGCGCSKKDLVLTTLQYAVAKRCGGRRRGLGDDFSSSDYSLTYPPDPTSIDFGTIQPIDVSQTGDIPYLPMPPYPDTSANAPINLNTGIPADSSQVSMSPMSFVDQLLSSLLPTAGAAASQALRPQTVQRVAVPSTSSIGNMLTAPISSSLPIPFWMVATGGVAVLLLAGGGGKRRR